MSGNTVLSEKSRVLGLAASEATAAGAHQRSLSSRAEDAYAEYCHLAQTGESIDLFEFASRFPAFADELLPMLEAHELLANTPGLLAALSPWPEPGDDLLHYRLRDEIGRGAFARVFLAEDTSLADRRVVLKVCRESVRVEASALGKLAHENIVPILSVQRAGCFGVMCMPYYGCATLDDVLSVRPSEDLSNCRANRVCDEVWSRNHHEGSLEQRARFGSTYLDCVVELSRQVAAALEFAHAQGFVHSDVKPSNVLVTNTAQALLLDFNLTATIEDAAYRGGTFPYMSPEQLEQLVDGGDSVPVDCRTDVFSCGVLLYQLITGTLPFGSPSRDLKLRDAAAWMLAQHAQGCDRERLLGQCADRKLADVVLKCLTPDASGRFPSGGELRRELTAFGSRTRRAKRLLCRHRSRAVGAAVFLLAVLVSTALALTVGPSREDALRAQVAAAFERGDVASAETKSRELLQLDSQSQTARLSLALAEVHSGDYASAIELLRPLLKTSDDGRLYATLGYCTYMLVDDHAGAAFHLEQAIESGVRTPEILNDLGLCRLRRGHLQEAMQLFSEALEYNPMMAAALYNRADAYFRLAGRQRHASSNSDITQLIRMLPDDPVVATKAAEIQAFRVRHEPANTDALQIAQETLQAAVRNGASKQDIARVVCIAPGLTVPDGAPKTAKGKSRLERFVFPVPDWAPQTWKQDLVCFEIDRSARGWTLPGTGEEHQPSLLPRRISTDERRTRSGVETRKIALHPR